MIQAGAQVGISLVMVSRRLQRLQLQPQLTKRLGSWDARSAAPPRSRISHGIFRLGYMNARSHSCVLMARVASEAYIEGAMSCDSGESHAACRG